MSAVPVPPGGPARPPPSRGWYVLAGLVMLVSTLGAGVAAGLTIRSADVEPVSFTAPGSVRVEATAGTAQTVFLQTRGSPLGPVAPDAVGPGDLDCAARAVEDDASVPLRSRTTVTLGVGEREYVSKLRFTPPADGTYEVVCAGVDGESVPLAVGGAGALLSAAGRLVLVAIMGLAGVALGGVTVAVVAVRRRRGAA